MKTTITGIPSGDLECWCLLVDKATFVALAGHDPEEWDHGRFAKEGSPYQYALYPHDLIKDDDGKPVTFTIETHLDKASAS